MIARDQKRPNKLFGAWICSGICRLRLAEGAGDLGASAGLDQLGASQPISWRFSGAFFLWGRSQARVSRVLPCLSRARSAHQLVELSSFLGGDIGVIMD